MKLGLTHDKTGKLLRTSGLRGPRMMGFYGQEKSHQNNQADFGKINMKTPRYRVRYGQASKGRGGVINKINTKYTCYWQDYC